MEFVEFKDIPEYPYPPEPIGLLRQVSNQTTESKNPEEMLNAILNLRQMMKYKYDLFVITFTNLLNDFMEKYLNPEGDENVLIYSIKFLKELLFNWNNQPADDWYEDVFNGLVGLFNFDKNLQIQNLAREVLGLFMIDECNTNSVSVVLVHILNIQNKEELQFWLEKCQTFLSTIDAFTVENNCDWETIICDIQNKIDKNCYEQSNLHLIQQFFVQLKSKIPNAWGFINGYKESPNFFLNDIF